jgi:hypoxanthine-DNA glycosylase
MERCNCLPPLISDSSHTIILGTFPSKESLRNREYYANPKNHFWDFMFRIFDPGWNYFDLVQGNKAYSEKTELISKNGIALWDVIESCIRFDNRDSSIKGEVTNDIEALLMQNRQIKRLIFTSKAFDYYKKNQRQLSSSHKIVILNSTSSLNPNNTFSVLLQWRSELLTK